MRPKPKFADCRLCGTDDVLDPTLPTEEAIESLGYYEDEDGYVCQDCQEWIERKFQGQYVKVDCYQ